MTQRTCSIEDCDKPVSGRGWCQMHYARWKKHGDPLRVVTRIYVLTDPAERFWAKVDKNGPLSPIVDTQCWVWTGSSFPRRDGSHYGQFWLNGRNIGAHRYSYELATGVALGELQIDHRCHNTLCVNPEHLRTATAKQNNENQPGAMKNNRSSGIRGITWHKRDRHWQASVKHNGQPIYVGCFKTLGGAEAAVIAKRNELFTYNDADR